MFIDEADIDEENILICGDFDEVIMSHGGDIYTQKVDIDFSVNLNPGGIRDEMKEALRSSLDRCGEYPDTEQRSVRKIIAEEEGLDPSNVLAGCGASELIPAVIRSLNAKNALVFTPSYTGYERALSSAGVKMIRHATSADNDLEITMEDLSAITHETDLIILCDPVNPSGKNIRSDVIYETLLRACSVGAMVMIDESFYHMSEKSRGTCVTEGTELLRKTGSLVVLRSLTKLFCIPGIRAGVALGPDDLIHGITRQVPEWNLPVTSEAAIRTGYELMKDRSFFEDTFSAIRSGRKYLTESLRSFGFKVYDSDTSFILFEGPDGLKGKLLEKGILIRECGDQAPLSDRHYRIAVRNEHDNRELIQRIGESIV